MPDYGFGGGEVAYCGDRASATEYLAANGGRGKAIVGYTATAGDYGTATAGDIGTALAGDYGTATAGDFGILKIKFWHGGRYRFAVGYVGEDGISPNVLYHVENGKLTRKERTNGQSIDQ